MILTIGREFGSGGRELGRRLAQALQLAYYDQEIVTQIAQRTELSEQYIQQVMERRPYPLFPITIGHSLYPRESAALDQARSVYTEQSRIITELADKSPCVIVGRCADYILRERKPFTIFVYASMDSKLARCRAQGGDSAGLSDKELRAHIQSVDRNRAAYYEFYTGRSWGDKLNYDLCINTTNTDIRRIAAHLTRMLAEM